MKNKSIIINEKAHKELKILSESFNTNYGDFTEKMILYFKKTGNDPTDQKNHSASQKLQTLDKRFVSFIKVLQRDHLNPMRNEAFEYHQKQEKQLSNNHLNTIEALSKINDINAKRNKFVLQQLEKQQKALTTISEFLDKKNKAGLISNIQQVFK